MPELPEVETVRKSLLKSVKNKTIKDVIILRSAIIEGDINKFKSQIKDKKILDIDRLGKFLIFKLSEDLIMLSHLRMEGKFILGKDINDKSQYARIIFVFDDKSILNFDDSRVFGYIALRKKNEYLKVPPLSNLGKEANKDIDIDSIYPLFKSSNRTIKETLLDQSIISGLGNIYVDETLFKSKISPLSKSSLLNKKDIQIILDNAKEILNLAIKFNGSTIKSFNWGNHKDGNFQNFLKCYGKKGENCPNCGTKFLKIRVGGRGTTYCPKCQKLITDKYVIGITGPISVGKTTALEYFQQSGYITYSADEAVNNLYLNKEVQKILLKTFKTSNKNEIRNIVSKDINKLRQLNNIIHPLVKKDIQKFIKSNDGYLAIEVPLLFQSNMDQLMDETLLILSSKNKELINNRGLKSCEQLNINNNLNFNQYKSIATYIVYNESNLKEFKNNLEKIIK